MEQTAIKALAEMTLHLLRKAGATKAHVRIAESKKHELNVANSRMSLYRTTDDISMELMAMKGYKKGVKRINQLKDTEIEEAVLQTVKSATDSQDDEANDIADYIPSCNFQSGPEVCDFDRMYDKLDEFIGESKKEAPLVNLLEGALEYVTDRVTFLNSNGVHNTSRNSFYHLGLVFMAVEGNKSSSFNYSDAVRSSLSGKLSEHGSLMRLIRESQKQLEPKPFPGNFVGDIVITPDCMNDFLSFIIRNLTDQSIYTRTSIFTDKLNRTIGDQSLTLYALPVGEDMPDKMFFTDDGYKTRDRAIIQNGVLNTYLLSLYGAKKTGLDRADTVGSNLVMVPGNIKKEEMISRIKKGVLLGRFSGGDPAPNGDFSGVAKNSFLIEDGEIKHALQETMISGNFSKMLFDIKGISAERTNFGSAIIPWVHVDGIQVISA
jgi:PmbA protein